MCYSDSLVIEGIDVYSSFTENVATFINLTARSSFLSKKSYFLSLGIYTLLSLCVSVCACVFARVRVQWCKLILFSTQRGRKRKIAAKKEKAK